MPARSKQDFRNIELDPGLLSSPFRVRTNWHVITGASCSGKTTLVDQLADHGFQTGPEPARRFVKSELAKGRTLEKIRQDRAEFTSLVYDLMLERERRLPADQVTFLDRAIPDALAFFRFAGLNPNEILADCFLHRYASVFILDRLPYQQDGVRAGDNRTAAYFDSWTSRDYSALGYIVVRVPVLPPEERLTFVMDRLAQKWQVDQL